MREVTETGFWAPAGSQSLIDHLAESAAKAPRGVALLRKHFDRWVPVTFEQLLDEVRTLARGIAAAGVQPGDRVAILAAPGFEWTVAGYAAWYIGAITVPIDGTSAASQLEWILSDSGAVAAFLGGPRQRSAFEEVAGCLPNVRSAWAFDMGALDDLAEQGQVVGEDDLEARRATLGPRSLATIMYPTRATGSPKGRVLTHGSLMFEADAILAALPGLFAADSSVLLDLPASDAFGTAVRLACIRGRVRHGNSHGGLAAGLASFRPTLLLPVGQVLESFSRQARQQAQDAGRARLFDLAESTAIEFSRALDAGGPRRSLRTRHAAFERLVYRRLRSALGGQLRYAICDDPEFDEQLAHFLRGIGIQVLQGYGSARASVVATINRPDATEIGSVGRPLPGTAVRVADDGEILLRGPHIFAGYWNEADTAADVVDADGWLHCGDIGELDAAGFLRLVRSDRGATRLADDKDAGAAVLEDQLRAHALVSQALVVGGARPFTGALIALDLGAAPAWLASRGRSAGPGLAALVQDPALIAEIQSAVDEANKSVSAHEAIRKFTLLPTSWAEGDGKIPATPGPGRSALLRRFAPEVEALYD